MERHVAAGERRLVTSQQIRPRDLGYRAEVAEAFAPYQSGHWLGRVAWTDRAGADVFMVTEDSVTTSRATFGGGVLSDAASDRSRLPVVGDWVAVRSWHDDRSTVEAVLARRTELACEEASGSTQESVAAANFDVIVIVEPVDAGPDTDRVDRPPRLAPGTGARSRRDRRRPRLPPASPRVPCAG